LSIYLTYRRIRDLPGNHPNNSEFQP
jgi:hypothetical protein